MLQLNLAFDFDIIGSLSLDVDLVLTFSDVSIDLTTGSSSGSVSKAGSRTSSAPVLHIVLLTGVLFQGVTLSTGDHTDGTGAIAAHIIPAVCLCSDR